MSNKNLKIKNLEQAENELVELEDQGRNVERFTDYHVRVDSVDIWPSVKKYKKKHDSVRYYENIADIFKTHKQTKEKKRKQLEKQKALEKIKNCDTDIKEYEYQIYKTPWYNILKKMRIKKDIVALIDERNEIIQDYIFYKTLDI